MYFQEIIAHPQDKILENNSTINFTCKSSISYDVTFSWTHNGRSISGSSASGDTSILTITSLRGSDAGSYVCTLSSGSLSVMSNIAKLAPVGMMLVCLYVAYHFLQDTCKNLNLKRK